MSGMGMNGANQTDNGHIEKMNAFLDRVTEEIVGLREKKMVREEMEDHIEDEAFELMDEGMNESAAYVEAVSRMGDANELAHELMLAHPYDSNKGFNKMLTVLWIGIFLIWLPDVNNMRPDAISWNIYYDIFLISHENNQQVISQGVLCIIWIGLTDADYCLGTDTAVCNFADNLASGKHDCFRNCSYDDGKLFRCSSRNRIK